jgi:hypothetical protein
LRERNVNDLLITGDYRLGALSVEPEEPEDFPDAPPPVAPDELDEPRDPLAPEPLDDLPLTPNAWAVLSSTVPVMVKPSAF